MKILLSLLILLISLTTSGLASEDPSNVPSKAMSKLAGIIGNWSVTTYYFDQQTQSFEQQAKSTLAVTSILKGLGIRETPVRLDEGKTIGIDITFGYDQYRNVYRLYVLDDSYGVPDVYEGQIERNQLIATNIDQGTHFPLKNGGKLEFRFTMDLSGDKRTVLIHMTADAGQQWLPMYRYEYERIK